MKKILIIIPILLFLFVMINNVCAGDIFVSTEGNNSGTGSKNSPYQDIQTGYNNAINNDRIILEEGIYNSSNDRGISISKNIIIAGVNKDKVIIDAKKLNRMFTINNGYVVTFENITFINGYVNNGNGSVIYSLGKLTINNCDFKNNYIYSDYNGSYLPDLAGGAIYNVGNGLFINNSKFINNSGLTNNYGICGGAVYNQGRNFILNNSLFINSSTISQRSQKGGAVYNNGDNFLVLNTNFTNNQLAKNMDSVGDAGAIYNQGNRFYVDNCIFTNNSAFNHGAIHSVYSDYTVINNSKFYNNWAEFLTGAFGIIYSDYVQILNSTFINNTATSSWAGAVFLQTQYSKISNSTFINNKVSRHGSGGAVWINLGNNLIEGCYFENNSADAGGAIELLGNNVSVINSKFVNNSASRGSAINYIPYNFENITINNCSFENNTGDYGTLHINGGFLKINNSFFSNNTANEYGGGIYGIMSILFLNNSEFINNNAKIGGALYNYNGSSIIENSTFNNNIASEYGGAISQLLSNMTINNGKFNNNIGQKNQFGGGAIYNSGNLTVIGSKFNNNKANAGGAIYNNFGSLKINNTEFKNNSASGTTYGGGAIYSDKSNITINKTLFANNTAVGHGGAIYEIESHSSINKSEFVNNSASINGGGIYNLRGELIVYYSNFISNFAIDGSAICINNSNLTFSNNLFKNNVAIEGRTVPFKYGNNFNGNLFNRMASSNVYETNIEQFSTSISIVSVEIINNTIVRVIIYCYDKYNEMNVPAGRNVQFKINESIYEGFTDENGFVTIFFNLTKTGNYTIDVILNTTVYVYDNERWGNDTYYVYKYSNNSSNAEIIIKIPTQVIVNIGPGNMGDIINITAILTDKNNNPLVGQELIFKKDGVEIGRGITDENGRVIITYLVTKEETINVTAYFNGFNDLYEPSEGYDIETFRNKTNSNPEPKPTPNPDNNETDLKPKPNTKPTFKPNSESNKNNNIDNVTKNINNGNAVMKSTGIPIFAIILLLLSSLGLLARKNN